MKTKTFFSSALFLAVLFTVTAIGVGEASAATGRIETGVINSGETVDNVRGGHTVGAGQVTEIIMGIDGHHGENGDNMPPEERIKKQEGTITIMKRLPDNSLEVIEHRMKTGTVKFFNETKGFDDGSQTDKGRSIPENSIEMIAMTPNGDKVIQIIKGIRN